MSMDNASHIRPQPVDQQMHRNFRGNAPAAFDKASLVVHDHEVGGPHAPLAHASRSHQNPILVQPYREVPIGGRHESTFVQHAPKADNLVTEWAINNHGK
jgi:hypothetical protein